MYLTAAAISSLIQSLPSGTAYCIGIVLMVMMTGRLMQHKGSLARAVLPLVIQLRGGWHRVEDCHRAGRAVRANIVAAAISIVLIRGVRLGLGRRVRFGASGEAAVSKLFAGLPKSAAAHLIVVDA